jgi:Asp/Glu/hydantoin racemase
LAKVELRTQLENEARLYGVDDELASVRAVDLPVLALEQDLERTRALLVEQAVLAVEQDGAHAIIFGSNRIQWQLMAPSSGDDPFPVTPAVPSQADH